ncbi:chitin-binding type-2 domain-containing protein [Nephila pilipes]|uniref:Chitin-binding type-2 domain-containing protein n=1 Tax=Nephila pilipes TaxID=299642 RepID=A0A8X6NW17_NEPPI|nr:chitin-binding type-2 domain-containing protein [Nephila pilipes]
MGVIQLIAVSLAMVSMVYGYSCPNDDHSFYHADVSTGCQVYHHCENSEMSTFTCPTGQAFDHRTTQCLDASVVECIETAGHHHHKRSVDVIHSISIEDLKHNFLKARKAVRSALREALQESAPSIYKVVEEKYAPAIESFKNDMAPIFKEKILPRIVKSYDYFKRIAGIVIEKLCQSYELSNSTHINLVSFSDLVDEIGNDMKPVLQLGRYLSGRLAPNTRSKRSANVPINEAPELIVGLLEPYLKDAFTGLVNLFSGDDETFTGKVILPVIMEMLNDAETQFDIKRIFWSAKSAYAPLINEMLRRESIYTPEGTLIRIPKAEIDAAKDIYYKETQPIIKKLFRKHLPLFLNTLADNVQLFFSTLDRLRDASHNHIDILQDNILNFFMKHGSVLRSSENGHISSYTYTEITKDLKPIEVTFLQIALDYFSRMNNSWVSKLFTTDSIVYRTLLGSEPIYAKPSGKDYKSTYDPVPNYVYHNSRNQ